MVHDAPAAGTEVEDHHENVQEKLTCPVCHEDMISLAQLSQHFEDEHVMPDEPTPPPKPQRKTRPKTGPNHAPPSSRDGSGWLKMFGREGPPKKQESPKLAMTRSHWQPEPKPGSLCPQPNCKNRIDQQGVHCRECGKLYCRDHTWRHKRLGLDAKPDPVGGMWTRVCINCFESKPGFNDNSGCIRDRTAAFNKLRLPAAERKTIIRDRLEKRLKKLIAGIAKLDIEAGGIWGWKDVQSIRNFEQNEIVAWEDERPHERCRFCGQKFSYFMRKHHCRVCGLVVCGDLERDCSREVALSVAAEKLGVLPLAKKSTYPIRICVECRNTVFSRRTFLEEVHGPLPRALELNKKLKHIQNVIDEHLPVFENLVAEIAASDGNKDPEKLKETQNMRVKILSAFTRYDETSREIADYEPETDAEARIQANISAWAKQYLQANMLTLQALPQVLKASPSSHQPTLRKDEVIRLQNEVMILEEQRFLLEKQLDEAKAHRHFDSIAPLQASVEEISTSLEAIHEKLGGFGPTQ